MTTSETIPTAHWYGSWFRYSPILLFAAGFISVLVFQQGAHAILYAIGFIPSAPFSASGTWPLEVPQIWSFAFWGGVWGSIGDLRPCATRSHEATSFTERQVNKPTPPLRGQFGQLGLRGSFVQ